MKSCKACFILSQATQAHHRVRTMNLYTSTQQSHTIIGDTFFKRLKGLKKANSGTCLILPNCRAIHTIGMKKAIIAIFLDKKNHITKINHIPPWRIVFGPPNTQKIIEILL